MKTHRPNLVLSDGRTRMTGALVFTVALGLLGLFGLLGVACQPSIGDACVLSTDCSQRGDRLCDTSQVAGYCTIFNCVGNGCPDEGSCVVFGGQVPGCLYSDRSIARTARSFCLKTCLLDKDCRGGYVCRDPRGPSLQGIILDDNQSRPVCVPKEPDAISTPVPATPPPVCSAGAPDAAFDASREAGPPPGASADSGPSDANPDGPRDADPDGPRDADAGGG